MTIPSTPALMIAAAPFDNSYGDADVILRSADGVDFYLHKNILRIASAFFADMFSLPQPLQDSPPNGDTATADVNSRSSDAPPIIPVSEDQQTLDNLLRMCYPVEKPAFDSIEDKCSLLRGTVKYQMQEATARLTKELKSLCASRPLDVFAAAWGQGLDDFVEHAAEAFCALLAEGEPRKHAFAIDTYTPLMDDIPASVYYQLLAHYSDRGRTGNSNGVFRNQTENAIAQDNVATQSISSHPFEDPARADLVIRSSDGVVFYVLKIRPVHRPHSLVQPRS